MPVVAVAVVVMAVAASVPTPVLRHILIRIIQNLKKPRATLVPIIVI